MLVGVAAYGNDHVGHDVQLVKPLRLLTGDVDPRLLHHLHSSAIEAMGFNAGRKGLVAIWMQMPSPALGHLAPARIARAEEQDVLFVFVHGPMTSGGFGSFTTSRIDVHSRAIDFTTRVAARSTEKKAWRKEKDAAGSLCVLPVFKSK